MVILESPKISENNINGNLEKKGWKKVKFFDFCVLQRGYDLPIAKSIEGPYPIVTSAGIVAYHNECKAKGPGVCTGRSGSIGNVFYIEKDFWPHNTSLFVKDFKGNSPKFVYYYLRLFDLSKYSASTAVPTMNRNNLRDIYVNVPPLEEQQRIVASVEAFMAHVNTACERLSRVPVIIKKFRQAILSAACTGGLTEEWREENPDVEEWKNVEFFDFCVLQRGYDLPIATCVEGPYPVVSSAGIVAYHNECKAKSPCVSMGRSGSIENIFYIEKDFWPHNTALFVKDFKGNLPKFVYYYLRYFDPSKYSASTAVPTMNRNNLRGITVNVPSLSEQHEIVRRVNMLFERADAVEREVAAATKRTEALTQAVLGKAFCGELVPAGIVEVQA